MSNRKTVFQPTMHRNDGGRPRQRIESKFFLTMENRIRLDMEALRRKAKDPRKVAPTLSELVNEALEATGWEAK